MHFTARNYYTKINKLCKTFEATKAMEDLSPNRPKVSNWDKWQISQSRKTSFDLNANVILIILDGTPVFKNRCDD